MTHKAVFLEYRKTKDIGLRNKIVEDHMYMVGILIRKYLNRGVEYDDLYQVASLALISAVERFDPDRGFDFSSFATPTIIGDIKKHFRDKTWSMKVPRRIKEMFVKIPGAREKLTLSLDQTFRDFGEDGEAPAFERFTADDEKGYDRIENGEMIRTVLKELSDTNRYIFRQRFIENKSQREIAKELGVSQMTVSRAERNIKNKFAEEMQLSM